MLLWVIHTLLNTYELISTVVFIHVSIQKQQHNLVRSVLGISLHMPVTIISVNKLICLTYKYKFSTWK
jgi:hypothetical protein